MCVTRITLQQLRVPCLLAALMLVTTAATYADEEAVRARGLADGVHPTYRFDDAHIAARDENLSLCERDTLMGDAGGIRSALEQKGLSVELLYTSEGFWNTGGGIKTGGQYRGDFSMFMELDTAGAGWWENGTFFVHLQHEHGNGITDRYTGDFQVLSNMDADDYEQVSEIWYRHMFADERLWVKLGKQEANEDFAGVEYGGEFINSSAGVSPTIPLVTFPDQDWGVVIGLEPVDWFSINLGTYHGRPNGGRSPRHTIHNLYGPMVMVEPAVHYDVGGLPGHFRVGGWWNGDKFDEIDEDDPAPGIFGESRGWYLTMDQAIWQENPSSEGDEQGVGMFGQYGQSPEDRSEAEHYVGGGLQWIGAAPGRDDDIVGLGAFHVEFSDEAGFDEDSETAIEMFYKAQVCGWFSVKPEVQYIANPGGTDNDDAVAVGMRCEVSF